jgi:(p)ppGpp synthase/HD superfamily hydrolase
MNGLDPFEPTKEALHKKLLLACALLGLSSEQIKNLEEAFDISYEGHKLAPRRASGEIYFMHVYRQFTHAVTLMHRYCVVSVEILQTILLHDTLEDAIKGKKTPFLMKSQIHLRLCNDKVECFVMCVSKKILKNESRDAFLIRVIRSEFWEVLVTKPFDCEDNIVTLSALPLEKQPGKIREVFEYYPHMKERAIHLITIAGEKGELPHHERWIRLVNALHKTLRSNAYKEKRRLEALGTKVV